MEVLQDPDEMLLCPYNSSHRIRRNRMATHLVKCKKNYPKAKMVECDFNCTHIIPEPELKYHHDHCVDRKNIEITTYQEVGQDLNKYPVVPLNLESDECWDNDESVPTYDPMKYCMDKPILRSLNVAPAAERKKFRLTERKRIAEIEANAAKSQSQSSRQAASIPSPRPSGPVITEDVPANVDELMKSIRLNANNRFVPKVNPSD